MPKHNYNKSLKELVNKLKTHALSNYEMLDFEPTVIHEYQNIENNIFHVDQLLDRKNRCIIFFPTNIESTEGHWTCCCLNDNNFEWFESYGINPIFNLNTKLNGQQNLNPKYLVDKIKNDGYTFSQNKLQLQNMKDPNNNACGRFVLLRLALSNLTNEQFNKFLKDFKNKYNINPLELSILYTKN